MTTELARGILGVAPRKREPDLIDALLDGARVVRETARRLVRSITGQA